MSTNLIKINKWNYLYRVVEGTTKRKIFILYDKKPWPYGSNLLLYNYIKYLDCVQTVQINNQELKSKMVYDIYGKFKKFIIPKEYKNW